MQSGYGYVRMRTFSDWIVNERSSEDQNSASAESHEATVSKHIHMMNLEMMNLEIVFPTCPCCTVIGVFVAF
jgi:hypothetical protein